MDLKKQLQITGQAYQKDSHFELLPFSYRLEELFEERARLQKLFALSM